MGRQADILMSPTNPGAHTEQRILWLLRIRTSLAADLIVAVAARVQPGWVAPLIPGHLDWVLLEPPDKALHQTKLDKPPRDEEEETGATMLRCQMAPHSLLFHTPHHCLSTSCSLSLPPPVSPLPSGTDQEGSDLSSTLWSCRV